MTLAAIVPSCSNLSPAGFWEKFHPEFVTTSLSDQGPRGGHREIRWKIGSGEPFTSKEIIAFAKDYGWELTDSLVYTRGALTPFTNYDEADYSYDLLLRFLTDDNSPVTNIFVFKSNWIAVEPGNARDTEKNGFVFLNSTGTELIVYHLWGE